MQRAAVALPAVRFMLYFRLVNLIECDLASVHLLPNEFENEHSQIENVFTEQRKHSNKYPP